MLMLKFGTRSLLSFGFAALAIGTASTFASAATVD